MEPRAPRLPLFLLGILLIAQAGLSWRWMHANGFLVRPPTIEAAYYRERAVALQLVLRNDGVLPWLEACAARSEFRTLLFPAVASAVAAGSDQGLRPIDLWRTIAGFAALFVLGAWTLARHFGGRWFALAVAAVTACCPVFVAYQRPFYPQLPMMAVTLFALDAFLRTRAFTRQGASIAAGALTAVAAMFKVIAPLYVAGAALAALAFGIADRPRRGRVLKNALLCASTFLVLVAPWQALHLHKLLDYTRSATDDSIDLRAMPGLDRVARWVYYPRHLLNDGFAFPLGVLVAIALAWAIRRAWSTRHLAIPGEGSATDDRRRAAWVLGAAAAFCYPVLTLGQAAGESQYVMVYVPAGALLAVAFVRARTSSGGRAAAVAVLALSALFGRALADRPPSRDETRVEWAAAGIAPVSRIDWYVSSIPRQMDMQETPQGERWPVAEFARVIRDHRDRPVPRVATSIHPYLCGSNLNHEARLLGFTMDEVVIDWGRFLGTSPDYTVLDRVDFLVLDSLHFPLDASVEFLRGLGYDAQVLARETVTARSTVSLIHLRRS